MNCVYYIGMLASVYHHFVKFKSNEVRAIIRIDDKHLSFSY